MNRYQRIVLALGSVMFLVAGVGYLNIGIAAKENRWGLAICWIMILVSTTGLMFVFKSSKPKPKGDA